MSMLDLQSPDVTDLTEEEFLELIGRNPWTNSFEEECDLMAGGDRALQRLVNAEMWRIWRDIRLYNFRELKKQQQE